MIKLKIVENIVKIGDSVRLLNKMAGTIKTIDKAKGRFSINGEYDFLCFVIADILELNGVDVGYNMGLAFDE